MARRTLTDAQTKVFDEVERTLNDAFLNARAQIAGAGFRADENTIFCTLCDCDDFVPKRGSVACGRNGCGHSFFRHNVW